MSLAPELFACLVHLGSTVTVRTLHEQPTVTDAVALRHDIDHDLDLALEVAHHEHARGLRASYYLLHTHAYWDDPHLEAKCRQLVAYGHEVGLHLNALTAWIQGDASDVNGVVATALARLRAAGIDVIGTSAHGDRACYEHGFANDWIWREMRGDDPAGRETGRTAEGVRVNDPAWQLTYPADHRLRRGDGTSRELWDVSMTEHGVAYDAYHVPHDHYWSDSGGGWTRTDDPAAADLSRGRHQVLIHPHWWRGKPRTVVVVSTARAGSKWLTTFVNAATSAQGDHEWTLNHRRRGGVMVPDKRTNDDVRTLEEHPAIAHRLIREMATWRSTIVRDRLEANVYLEPFLEELVDELPDVALVHLHRDGRAVVRSILNRGWYDVPDDRRHRTIPVPSWPDLTRFERACWYYRFTQERLLAATDRRLAFERVIADERALVAALSDVGIVTHPTLAAEVGGFDEPVNRNKREPLPPYAEWPESFRRTFDRICGGVQRALGYECEFAGDDDTTANAAHTAAKRTMVLTPEDVPPLGVADHVRCTQGPGGVTLAPSEPGQRTANCMLTPGSWRNVTRRQGIACSPGVYFRGEIRCVTSDPATVRLFALFFDAAGTQIERRSLARLRAGDDVVRFGFRPRPAASHCGLALHFGDQPVSHSVRLESIRLEAIAPSPDLTAGPVAPTPAPAPGTTVLTLNPTTQLGPARHVSVTPGPDGMTLAPTTPGERTAHCMLTAGRWGTVTSEEGLACRDDAYFRGEIRLTAADDVTARLFALFFDEGGHALERRQVATLRGGVVRFTFRPPDGASHCALAAHFGDQPSSHWVRVESMRLESVPLRPGYAALPNAAERVG